MIQFFLSMNPILQLAWIPILAVLSLLIIYCVFEAIKFIVDGIVWTVKAERQSETYDSEWMDASKWVLSIIPKGEYTE